MVCDFLVEIQKCKFLPINCCGVIKECVSNFTSTNEKINYEAVYFFYSSPKIILLECVIFSFLILGKS